MEKQTWRLKSGQENAESETHDRLVGDWSLLTARYGGIKSGGKRRNRSE